MKIIKIGTFDKKGTPVGWMLDVNGVEYESYCLGIIDEMVTVNGVEIVEWTIQRKEIMSGA